MITSENFYALIAQAMKDCREQIERSGAPKANFFIFSNTPYGLAPPELHIWVEASGEAGLKVEGKHLQELVDEYIRRAGFKNRQAALQLAAPTPAKEEDGVQEAEYTEVLQPPQAPISDPQDDEIPF